VDQRVRNYLITAHNKVIAHCHELQASSLPATERERILRLLSVIDAELKTIKRYGASDPMQLAQAA